jgi:hypothetical protein
MGEKTVTKFIVYAYTIYAALIIKKNKKKTRIIKKTKKKHAEHGSNTQPSDLQSDALPTELSPLSDFLLLLTNSFHEN